MGISPEKTSVPAPSVEITNEPNVERDTVELNAKDDSQPDSSFPDNGPSLNGSYPTTSFTNPGMEAAAVFLRDAMTSGKLGSGPAESDGVHKQLFRTLFQTFPWVTLLVQLLWTAAVITASYFLSASMNKNSTEKDLLGDTFWKSRLNVSSTVASGVGWALFVLLGLYIREASNRYVDAQFAIHGVGVGLRRAAAVIRQGYKKNIWHDGGMDRILAHLVAYPIALKMALRGEKEPEQLHPLLDWRDANDVAAASPPHLHCIRVASAYITAAGDDCYGFALVNANETPAGSITRSLIVTCLDSIDSSANCAMRIAHFRPAVGYINHLRIFLYIWLMFLPLTLIQSSGLFTILWSLLITYGVAMIFNHAHALNEPFGYDQQDIKLNRLCAKLSYNILLDSFQTRIESPDVVDNDHDTPRWLEEDRNEQEGALMYKVANSSTKAQTFLSNLRHRMPVIIAMVALLLWCTFAVLVTRIERADPEPETRWWTLYIPLTSGTTAYISLGVFILLGFWINDAYGRYWRALNLWQVQIIPQTVKSAYNSSLMCCHGALHQRDRERLLSFFVALPYASMLHLRADRDVSVLQGILSPTDLASLAEAPDFPTHVLHVIFAYLIAYDKKETPNFDDLVSKTGGIISTVQGQMSSLEISLSECDAIRKFQISPTFTLHLQLFTAFWIALLPFSFVVFHGYLTFLFVLLIGYSIINMLRIGVAMADPFGKDADDLPLEDFCARVRDEIRDMYPKMAYDSRYFVHPAPYSRADLTPKLENLPIQDCPTHEEHITVVSALKRLFKALPKVPLVPLVAAIVWMIAAVCLSWGLSRIPSWRRKDGCDSGNEWCSLIDVQPSVLGNVGFALFMILAFRASDAIRRYDDGAKVLSKLHNYLRTMALEVVQGLEGGTFHPNDKERIVAHIAQIPLTLRDLLLETWGTSSAGKDGVLCEEDRKLLETSKQPINHLLNTIEGYCFAHDVPNPSIRNSTISFPIKYSYFHIRRINMIHPLVEEAFCIKRFSVTQSYRKHQYKFAVLWLVLLPLSMAPQTGWFTILWASLIAYAVLGMEEIAIRLVDPYGTDAIDLPVQEMCENASAQILEAVNSVGWSSYRNITRSDVDEAAGISAVLKGNQLLFKYSLASFNQFVENADHANINKSSDTLEDQFVKRFSGPRQKRTRPTFFTHVMRSVPWWALLAVTGWTAIACIISFLTKDGKDDSGRWWRSFISISGSVGTYVSIAAFALLSFYVTAAYRRYSEAGFVWGDSLRYYCHSGVSDIFTLWPRDEFHPGDHNRVIGHLAAIPLALKAELRGSRDVREIKGLVSSQDLGRIQCAESMSGHCIDVIRSYLMELVSLRPAAINKKLNVRTSRYLVLDNLNGIEGCVSSMLHLEAFGIAPGFVTLLKGLLAVWFLILPFVLAELSGWFTILWIPIISYGVLGMYSLAAELQHPFGNDLNDLDIDHMANEIVTDVLDVYRMHPQGPNSLVRATPTFSPVWTDHTTEICAKKGMRQMSKDDNSSWLRRFWQSVQLAVRVVPWWLLLLIGAWSAIVVGVAKVVGEEFWEKKQPGDSLWFLSPIAISDAVKEYAGFALFLLLAFRLTDSHSRYVHALQKWQESMSGVTRLACGRIFQGCPPNSWHDGDIERIAGHLAAFPIMLMGTLRQIDYPAELEKVLDNSDVRRILSTTDRPYYCLDVVRAYLVIGEQMHGGIPIDKRYPYYDLCRALRYIVDLGRSAIDCKVIAKIPMPFGYVQHFRIFLWIWLLLLPLGLVETSGWVTILWVVIIAYGIIGIDRWAEELSDPFGFDVSDIPLERLCDNLFRSIKGDMLIFRNGISSLIATDRIPFQLEATGDDELDSKLDNQPKVNQQGIQTT